MKCPNCGLENPPSAGKCDCGYNFKTGYRMLPDQSAQPSQKKLPTSVIVIAVVIVLFLLLIVSQVGQKNAPDIGSSEKAYHESQPIEVTLAKLQDGLGTSEKDPLVGRFTMLLDTLDPKFVEDRKAIADMTVKAQQMLKAKGISERLDRIMEGMNTAMYSTIQNQKYAEYISAYLTLRENGQSHDSAVNGLKALIRSLGAK
jgi:hypothetical protein